MGTMERRVERLEEKAGLVDRGGKVHVIAVPKGADEDTLLKEAGIDPHPNDLVVFIRKFS